MHLGHQIYLVCKKKLWVSQCQDPTKQKNRESFGKFKKCVESLMSFPKVEESLETERMSIPFNGDGAFVFVVDGAHCFMDDRDHVHQAPMGQWGKNIHHSESIN